ncbi:tyrosine-type recombinase/integrase [Virgibacillus doumboii]|uniref:tyrosine-type recombinase/integrase n=1 Tax=Virgibacillus doumboii TaxID=2697503 RepID=UPI0013E04D31|nr:site-specific integrase [Virgibacillus doumboii]
MEQANKFQQEDLPLEAIANNTLINEFLHEKQNNNKEMKQHVKNILVDFYLHHGKEWHELDITECQDYLEYLARISSYKNYTERVLKKKVNVILQYLSFLHKRRVVQSELFALVEQHPIVQRTRNRKRIIKRSKTVNRFPVIIEDFLHFLKINDNRVVENKKIIVFFQRYLEREGININVFREKNKEKLLFEKIKGYEWTLSDRVTKEEILRSSATVYLRTVQLFVKFLTSQNLVNQKYTIPLHLRGRSKRANEYVPKESIIELMDTIYDYSKHVFRDLAIFLIIVDTGCRPIEVSNLSIGDFDNVQKTLSLACKKTAKRTIKISTKVVQVIKDYLEVREQYHPETQKLFVTCSGHPITPSRINSIFYHTNKQAFGESRYPAKAFRHTYITNALQEYSFRRVAETIGHKDWKSTYYYYHRSNQRLLANTLDKSPLKENGGKVHANTKTNER